MNTLERQLSAISSRIPKTYVRRKWRVACSSRRMLHTRRALEYPTENGVGSFLTPQGLQTILEWQDGLLDRLNEAAKGTRYANKSPLQTILDTSGNEDEIQTFNYATLAVNNSFFLDTLKPPESGTSDNEREISQTLGAAIINEFGSLAELKLRVVATAKGMMSSGWVWFVSNGRGGLAVLPTFGAGTLFVRLQGSEDQRTVVGQIIAGENSPQTLKAGATHTSVTPPISTGPSVSSPVSGVISTPPPLNPHTPARSFHSSPVPMRLRAYGASTLDMEEPEADRKRIYNLVRRPLNPLFCVSIHEHAWLSSGYGVWGKEKYMQNFFSAVHWGKVSRTYDKLTNKSLQV